MKTLKEVAALLDGREYGSEVTTEEAQQLKKDGFTVVFGYSDDCVEFRGAIYDEASLFEGGKIYLSGFEGLLHNDCEDDRCPYFKRLRKDTQYIEAFWDSEGYSWTFDFPGVAYETFDIMEDGEKYCRGIVFE